MADVFSILVFQGNLDPEYVLDRMSMLELHILVKNLYRARMDDWEIARQTIYTSAKVWGGTKENNPRKFMPLGWDDLVDKAGDNDPRPTKEDIERLKQKAKEYGTRFSNQDKT
jgi:hypothetical protein